MCGIIGIIDYSKNMDKQSFNKMRDSIDYRGPDDFGTEIFEKDNFTIALGHRRLSIQDLSPLGHQPMNFKNLSIIFNGEVYNFPEIKEELLKLNYTFISHSDTEVILKAFDAWGIKCVDRFRGMFAFCIYDKIDEKLYIVRDRVGVKPLYYYIGENEFIFGSELKAFYPYPNFKKEIDKDALSMYLQFGYIQAPFSIYKNCFKLLPGHYLQYDLKTKSYDIQKYWDIVDYYEDVSNLNEEEIKEELEKILVDSFNLRLVADVPVGTFLSGGIDSSLVTAILQKYSEKPIKTFTIGFTDEKYNEAPYAKAIAEYLGTDHTEHYCTPKDVMNIIKQLPIMYDEPFGDSSSLPTVLVSSIAKEHVSVVLSGDGGDELFGGYSSYSLFLDRFKKIQSLPMKKYLKILLNMIPDPILRIEAIDEKKYLKYLKLKNVLEYKDVSNMFKLSNSVFTKYEIEKMISNYFYKDDKFENLKIDNLEKMMLSDFKGYLADDILVKVDRASMFVSLESREPLLDNKIIEFSAKLPLKYKKNKYILKKILSKYIPIELFERKKTGFGIPINDWLRENLKYLIDEHLSEKELEKHNFFNIQYINELKQMFFQRKNDDRKIWTILMFQMWYKENIK